jgi:hypothetical protein
VVEWSGISGTWSRTVALPCAADFKTARRVKFLRT